MKLNLDKTYFYDGKQYGPGDAEVPDKIAPIIKKGMKSAKKQAKEDDTEKVEK